MGKDEEHPDHEAKKIRAKSRGKQKSHLDELKLKSDPLLELGFGINAYRYTLWVLWIVFFAMSIFACVMMYIYSQGTAYDWEGDDASYEVYTIGNLG